LRCAIEEMDADRVMFLVDWPRASNQAETRWLVAAPVLEAERGANSSGNARRLLRI